MLYSHRTENLSPILQVIKLRLREAQQVAAACPTWYNHSSLSGSKVCAWKAKYLGLLRMNGMFSSSQRSEDMGIYSQLGAEETGNWRGPSLTSEVPRLLPSPRRMGVFCKPFLSCWRWILLFLFCQERFFYEMDAEYYQMPFYHPWFFPFALLIWWIILIEFLK